VYAYGRQGYEESESVSAFLPAGLWHQVSFELPNGSGRGPIRIDPADVPAIIDITEIQVRRAHDGKVLWRTREAGFNVLRVNSEIQVLSQKDHFLCAAHSLDPQILLPEILQTVLGEPLVVDLRLSVDPEAPKAPASDTPPDLSGTREALERELTASHLYIAAAKEKFDRLHSDLYALQSERETSEVAILNSPAWKLLRKYRAWLQRQSISRPRLFARYESLVARFVAGSSAPNRGEERQIAGNNVGRFQAKQANRAWGQAEDSSYQQWIGENEPAVEELARQRIEAAKLAERPLLSLVVPVSKTGRRALGATLDSVREQTYENWELCIADASGVAATTRYLYALAGKDPRIRYKAVTDGGISKTSNAALGCATGEFVIFLDPGDLLAPFALFELAALLNRNSEVDVIYSDHDYFVNSSNVRVNPLFKPDWSPEIMFSVNYISHLTAAKRDLVEAVGRFNPQMDGAADWDLFLRLTGHTSRIAHIPKVLYHCRLNPEPKALIPGGKIYPRAMQLRAITAHVERVGMPAEAEETSSRVLHIRWKRTLDPRVSVIIPTRDNVTMLARCIASLRERTAYKPYEIIIIDTGSEESPTHDYYRVLESAENIRILSDTSRPFNYSRVNNYGARESRGDLLLFLNNDVEITNSEWLDELVGWGTYPPVGVVGAKLLYPDGTIQHAGVVVGLTGFAGHPFAGCPAVSNGLYGDTTWYRNYLAVTGACMLMRRNVFEELGGFDEDFLLCGSDVEICLRARKRGYRVMLNPFAELIHYEQQTRKTEQPPQDFPTSFKHYKTYLESGDPYWSPNLSYRIPQIGLRKRDEESAFCSAQKTLQSLGYLPALTTAFSSPAPVVQLAEERQFVHGFDFSQEDLRCCRENVNSIVGYRQVRTVMWFIPPFEYAYYGGIMTILRFARQWHQAHGVRSMFAVCGIAQASVMAQRVRTVYQACKDTDVFILRAPDLVSDLPPADAGIVTLWATAYFGLRYQQCRRMFYFIQDYEPAFYRAGSSSALAESTYRFGFYGITNTVSLRRVYETEYNGKAFHFNPCVDQTVFHPSGRETKREERCWQVFCYARPNHSRNAFELMAAAMRRLKRRLRGNVRIIAAGDHFDVAEHSLTEVVENHGVLSYEATAELYRECDVGIALMLTRHPSYIPLELMASGCLVVTNRSHWTEWLLRHEENCLLTEPSASCIAETIERGLRDETLRRTITDNALALVRDRYSDWNSEIRRIYEYICDPDSPRDRINV
jgi:GT2 family glycosyltransferase/glycosyltransferase involved in cell wall biosynthesis